MGLFNNTVYVTELVENYTAEEIDALKAKVREALESRVSLNLHVNVSTQEGRSTSGIALNTPEQQMDFLAACQAAKAQLDTGVTASPGAASHTDYSYNIVRT